MHFKDEFMPKYAELVHYGSGPRRSGKWPRTPSTAVRSSSAVETSLKLYKNSVAVAGRHSALLALRPGFRHLRGRHGRLRSPRRGRFHPPQRAAAAHLGTTQEEAGTVEADRLTYAQGDYITQRRLRPPAWSRSRMAGQGAFGTPSPRRTAEGRPNLRMAGSSCRSNRSDNRKRRAR
jgi:hypothetical protein